MKWENTRALQAAANTHSTEDGHLRKGSCTVTESDGRERWWWGPRRETEAASASGLGKRARTRRVRGPDTPSRVFAPRLRTPPSARSPRGPHAGPHVATRVACRVALFLPYTPSFALIHVYYSLSASADGKLRPFYTLLVVVTLKMTTCNPWPSEA